MIASVVAVLACLTGPSLALPLDFLAGSDPLSTDVLDYCGPFSQDFYRRGLAPDLGLPWPLNRYGSPWTDSVDLLNAGGLGSDLLGRFFYPGYPRGAVDYARENYVRGDVFGGTEFGTRDEVSVQNNGYWRSPYYRSSALGYPLSPYRRSLPYGLRSPIVPRFPGSDLLYYRR